MKKLVISYCFLLIFTNNPLLANNKVVDVISEEIGYSIKKHLPNNQNYRINFPSFLEDSKETAEQVDVFFPSSAGDTKIVAQVWLTTNSGLKLLAIPIYLQ
ncbi:MAG: hypothetical protein QNJ31_01285 [Candidatus Caenarcaniphilales bacterium]|nr:hypothetical protein [Candidatus Caenarcaniphilales bacterium]